MPCILVSILLKPGVTKLERNNVMKRILVIIMLASLASNAFAGDYKQFFLVNGAQATAEQAILASLRGAEAYKCTSVEAKVSKAGTSIGLKNIKKPRKE
jgi:hypothetical protein